MSKRPKNKKQWRATLRSENVRLKPGKESRFLLGLKVTVVAVFLLFGMLKIFSLVAFTESVVIIGKPLYALITVKLSGLLVLLIMLWRLRQVWRRGQSWTAIWPDSPIHKTRLYKYTMLLSMPFIIWLLISLVFGGSIKLVSYLSAHQRWVAWYEFQYVGACHNEAPDDCISLAFREPKTDSLLTFSWTDNDFGSAVRPKKGQNVLLKGRENAFVRVLDGMDWEPASP